MEALTEWAEFEFGQAQLGDKRRTARLVQLAGVLAEKPGSSLPEATGDRATLKAAYRFFDNDCNESVALLHSHVKRTYERMAQVPLVLATQDTTYLDFTAHPQTQGLGPLAQAYRQGLLVHSTLAFTPDRVPLGILAQKVWAREAETFGQLPDHNSRATSAKESVKWLESLAATETARQACPHTRFVNIGDREADIYDVFHAPRATGVDLLVRAAWDRRVEHEEKYLWAALRSQPVVATLELHIPPRDEQAARTATLEVRWRAVTVRPPRKRRAEKLPVINVWAVWAIETTPPTGVKPVEWMLLTTAAIQTDAQALERLEWYSCRWGIEVWHKVLKSGCRIEARQLETAERLQRCLTLYAVIAWRILYATLLARVDGKLPATVLLNEAEWQALYCVIHKQQLVPATPPSLAQAVLWIAQLGGFQKRKINPHPGVTVLWKGFQHLADLTRMYLVFRPQAGARDVGNS
jgi:hypothetical protein